MRVFLVICSFVLSIRCQECRVFDASSINEKNNWEVSRPEAEDRLLQMISDNVTCAVDCVLLKFLYVKGVFSSSHPLLRKTQFEFVMNPEQAGSDELVKHYSEVKERFPALLRQMEILLQMRFLKTYRRLIKLCIHCKTGIRRLGLMRYTYSTFTMIRCMDVTFSFKEFKGTVSAIFTLQLF